MEFIFYFINEREKRGGFRPCQWSHQMALGYHDPFLMTFTEVTLLSNVTEATCAPKYAGHANLFLEYRLSI
jgi:hypothetical protein